MKIAIVSLGLLLTGCGTASVDGYQWAWYEGDVAQFRTTKSVCLKEANSAYVPIAAWPWASKIRLTLYKDCMEKAGYVKL